MAKHLIRFVYKNIFIILFFILIGVIFSYPLVLYFGSAIPYTHAPTPSFAKTQLAQGDHLSLYYIYWLIKDYFISHGQSFFTEPYMFSIPHWPRPYEPRGLSFSIIFLLFSILGSIHAYNILVILSFVLSGLFTFLLAKKYLHDTPAAFVSGVIFSTSPFRLAQLFGGHPTGFILFWIPLIIYLYELLWEERKLIYGWAAGLCIFFMCIEEHHMGYYTSLFTIVFWLYKYLFQNSKQKLGLFRFSVLLIPILAGWALSGVYMLYVKSIVFNISVATGGRTFDEIKLYAPTIKHMFQRINTNCEKYIYIGMFAGILSIISIYQRLTSSLKDKKINGLFPFLFYAAATFISLLLTLGPNLKYLPIYKICYKIVPFFNFPRSPARLYMFTLIGLSLLSGYGAKILTSAIKNRFIRYTSACAIIVLISIDYHPFYNIGLSLMPKGNKTYDYVRQSSPGNPLLEIPLWPGESSWSTVYQYYTTIYHIPLINGYSPFVTRQYVDEIFWKLVSVNMGMINEDQYKLLKELNIKYINLHEEAYPQKVNPFPFKLALENLKKSPYLEFVLSDGPMYLFKILDKPLNTPLNRYTIPSKTGIFYECEYMPHRIGTVEEGALFCDQSVTEPTHLVFGPWQLFPPGRYKLIFRVKVSGNNPDDKIAALEIATDNGKISLLKKDLFGRDSLGKYEDYVLNITLDKLTVLEFRIIYYGKGPVWADYVYLLCEEENDPVRHYKAKDLFHIGREKDGAVYAEPNIDPTGNLVFGPYRRYPKGRYSVGFKLKAGEQLPVQSAVLKISNGHSSKPLIARTLYDVPTEYQIYWLEISLLEPTVLEFQVEFLKKVPIYVDSIEVKSIS